MIATLAVIPYVGHRAFRHTAPMTAQAAKAIAVWTEGNVMRPSPCQSHGTHYQARDWRIT